MRRFLPAIAFFLWPSAASADALLVIDEEPAFPKCTVQLETDFGPAKVTRTLSDGRYLHQYIFWRDKNKTLPAGFVISPAWRKARTTGLSEGPVLLTGLSKKGSQILSRSLRQGSKLKIAADGDEGWETRLIYGPLNSRKSRRRKNFTIDATELLERFKRQETVRLQVEERGRKGRPSTIFNGKLSLNFVRAFLDVDFKANQMLDKWQSGGAIDCPGEVS